MRYGIFSTRCTSHRYELSLMRLFPLLNRIIRSLPSTIKPMCKLCHQILLSCSPTGWRTFDGRSRSQLAASSLRSGWTRLSSNTSRSSNQTEQRPKLRTRLSSDNFDGTGSRACCSAYRTIYASASRILDLLMDHSYCTRVAGYPTGNMSDRKILYKCMGESCNPLEVHATSRIASSARRSTRFTTRSVNWYTLYKALLRIGKTRKNITGVTYRAAPIRTTVSMRRVAMSDALRLDRRGRNRNQCVIGKGRDHSMLNSAPTPTVGSPKRSRRMKRPRRVGGPFGVG